MCDEAGMNKEQFRSDQRLLEFGRQYNQTLSLIKSLLISWRHGKTDPTFCKNGNDSLKVIIFSNNRPIFDKLKSTVGSWNEKYTAPLNLEYRAAIFPEGKYLVLSIFYILTRFQIRIEIMYFIVSRIEHCVNVIL
jgi:hypothetical protein